MADVPIRLGGAKIAVWLELPVRNYRHWSAISGAQLNNHYPHPIIAREGWPFLLLAIVAAAVATALLGAWSWPFWLIALFVLQFFRDPPRMIPQQANRYFHRLMAVSWWLRRRRTRTLAERR